MVKMAMLSALACHASAERATFYVRQQGAEELRREAMLVSDPSSERYGDFLSFKAVVGLQQPLAQHLDAVHSYLDTLGVTDRRSSLAGDKIVVELPSASSLKSESLPPDVLEALDGFVIGGTTQKQEQARRKLEQRRPISTSSELPDCLSDYTIGAKCLRTLYNVNSLPSATHPDNLQTVVVNEGFRPSDLKSYLQEQGLTDQEVVKLVNGELSGQAETEASLDTQFIIALGSGTPTWWFYIDGQADNPFDAWLTFMSNTSTIPLVHSLSVGAPENAVGEQLVSRMNDELAALGARGSTIVFASGDSSYQPIQKFGAASPWVTSTGGVWNGELGGEDYLSVDDISTGGFSSLNANPLPEYQRQAVQQYLSTTGTRPAGFNSSRRCVPDVSLFDNGVGIKNNGQDEYTGGTSAAAPSLSGMLSLINDVLLHKGHSPLGFVNPLFYANAAAFQDITRGDNHGFAAVEGYDPASGLGTIGKNTLTSLLDAALAAKERAASKRQSMTV